jgi:hypothetical protein
MVPDGFGTEIGGSGAQSPEEVYTRLSAEAEQEFSLALTT